MNCLTKQEQQVVWVVVILLALGLAVKSYRGAHPDATKRGVNPAPNTLTQTARP